MGVVLNTGEQIPTGSKVFNKDIIVSTSEDKELAENKDFWAIKQIDTNVMHLPVV